MTPAPTLRELIDAVQEGAASQDPLDLLHSAAETAAELDNVKDGLLGYFVERCRGSGRSWSEISAALGVTKQAAHKRFSVASPSLDRFTERARRVVELCSKVAESLNHNWVGTEHLLLAILIEGRGIGARILLERGLTHRSAEAAALMVSPRGETPPVGEVPLTPRTITALTGAVTSAIELGHNYVGTEHLLLALMRDPDGLAARILTANDITADDVRKRVVQLLAELTSNAKAH